MLGVECGGNLVELRGGLQQLQQGLPDSFDACHSVQWSSLHDHNQRFGEIDLVVLSPQGNLVLLEVKAGDVSIDEHALERRRYANGLVCRNFFNVTHRNVDD